MTAKFVKPFAVALTAAIIGVSSLASPAMAGGQFSINYAPNNSEQAQVLGMGLQLYSMFHGMKANGANVSQRGNDNSAGGNQSGSNNQGVIVQRGNGHQGTIEQQGNNNSCGLFQFGRNTKAQCGQYGNGQSSLTTVFGF